MKPRSVYPRALHAADRVHRYFIVNIPAIAGLPRTSVSYRWDKFKSLADALGASLPQLYVATRDVATELRLRGTRSTGRTLSASVWPLVAARVADHRTTAGLVPAQGAAQ